MRKRSKYHPRKAHPHGGLVLMRRYSPEPLSRDQLRDLGLAYHSALQAFINGEGNGGHLATLSVASNTALLLCEIGLGDMAIAKAAQDACINVDMRVRRTNRYLLSGPDLRALQALVELHDAQLESPDCTKGAVVQALDEIHRRMKSGDVFQMEAT